MNPIRMPLPSLLAALLLCAGLVARAQTQAGAASQATGATAATETAKKSGSPRYAHATGKGTKQNLNRYGKRKGAASAASRMYPAACWSPALVLCCGICLSCCS